jgi:dynein heavy chain
VNFINTFNPKSAGGNVEKWLIDCEAAQRESVADVCRRAFDDYATQVRTKTPPLHP